MKTLISISLLLLIFLPGIGQGILFSEYRIILKPGQIGTLQVSNPTKEKRTYQLSVVNKTLDADGKMHDIPDSVNIPWALGSSLRVFPKRITLEPGASQEVQLQVKMPASQADGEYRSYLHFLPLLSPDKNEGMSAQEGGTKMNIIFRVGAAIPIMYRKNTSLPEISASNARLEKKSETEHLLHFTLNRKGMPSTYGTITVEGKVNGKNVILASRPGTAIYHEADCRNFIFPIETSKLDRETADKIRLTISYVDDEKKQTPSSTWTKQDFVLSLKDLQ